MKPKPRIFRLAPLALASAFWSGQAVAAPVDKADNADDLNLASSWSGGVVPGAGDVARWAGLAGANSALLGGDLSLRGITIGSTGGAITIAGGDTLTLGRSGIDMSGADQDLTIGTNLTLATGSQTWNVATGRVLTLATGGFGRSAGTFLNLQGEGTVSASMVGLANVNGILGPWVGVGSGSNTRYATLSGGNIVGYTGATSSANFGWNSANPNTQNYDVSGVGGALGVNRQANTVRYTGGAGTQNWGNNNTTTITLNGLMNVGTGTLTFGQAGGTSQGRLVIGPHHNNELVLHAANAGISIAIPIINNGATAGSVTIVGPNTVTFSASNTYTGSTRVLEGATLNFGGGSVTNAVVGLGSINSTGSVTVTGDFSGFAGSFTHNSSTASVSFNSATATSAGASYAIVSDQGSSQGMIAGGAGDYTLHLGSLSGVANSLFRGGNVATGTTTLEIGSLNTSTTFEGIIADGAAKRMALTKVGSGTLSLGGSNSYTGATLVSAGTLLVNGALGNTAVTVGANAGIGGRGVIDGSLAMDALASFMVVDLSDALGVAGNLTFGSGFGIANLTGIDWDGVALHTPYTLISTTQVFGASDIGNFGIANAAPVGTGRFAYFENGSLSLMVIPEPSVALLGGLGMLLLLRRRRG
jgi:autotransporter-associated beta strand protein